MNKLSIQKISKQKFMERLVQLPYENISVIRTIESFFKKKRGYIFRMPKPGTPVILLLSGGLDSVISWALLMHTYKLKVYPLFLHRGYKRKWKERKSVRFFSSLFAKRYPEYYVKPMEYSTHLPPPELEKQMQNLHTYYHAARVLENVNLNTSSSEIVSQSGLPIVYPFFALSYANHLWSHENIKVRTVFNAVATGDGIAVTSQTFTSLRATLLSFCVSTNQYDWQFASLPFEKEIGHWIDKAEFIRLGAVMDIPMEKTWSCYRSGRYQCGDKCATCLYRRSEFHKSGIPDKTIYAYNTGIQYIIAKLVKKFFAIIHEL